jgi:splicing factor 3B subunit 3
MLIAVPSGADGPGGLLVVLEDYLFYKNNKDEQLIRFPSRKDKIGNRKIQFTAHALFKLKGFFFLISS